MVELLKYAEFDIWHLIIFGFLLRAKPLFAAGGALIRAIALVFIHRVGSEELAVASKRLVFRRERKLTWLKGVNKRAVKNGEALALVDRGPSVRNFADGVENIDEPKSNSA